MDLYDHSIHPVGKEPEMTDQPVAPVEDDPSATDTGDLIEDPTPLADGETPENDDAGADLSGEPDDHVTVIDDLEDR